MQGIAGPVFPDFPAGLAGLGSSVVWCVSLCLLVTLVVVWSIRSSPLYPVLLAIRDAEPFAAAAGVRTSAMKVGIFGLSAALAGMAGWAFSFLGFVSPGQFSWTVSVNILVMVILGGMNTRLGPILGAAFISAFPVVVSIDPFIQEVVFGCIFVAVIVFFPTGIMGVASAIARRLRPAGAPIAVEAIEIADDVPIAYAPLAADVPLGADVPAQSRNADRSEEDALVCRSVVFSYLSGTRAVDGVDLAVRRGTIHGLIGPNGSGKSTLVNLISGQLTPDAGTIEVNGHAVQHLGAASRPGRGVMRTFQTAVLVKDLPARENVTIGLYGRVKHIPSRALIWPLIPSARRDHRDMREQARAALQSAGLDRRWAGALVADVPHGVEQLTQLAAACVGLPSILILDEPLAGLSATEVEQVSEILRRLQRDGVTVIVIEHQTRFIFEMCDDVTVLAAGQLVTTGRAADVRSNERVREVYLGQ